MEKFKIVSDATGQTCQLFIDGEQIKRVSSMRIGRTPKDSRFGLSLEITKYRTDSKGNAVLNEDKTAILEDVYYYDFSEDFSRYMNPPEDGD